ncbi:hypothetical protein OsI_21606 [Oryza sativa Indica Group]|uniref:Pectate lyase n=1 Tax=Oryza sativa subsp. indica TaxID=39946 RepID=A2Y967_ORYSI|nr:hypothetical protein OsI_21606 [Oryza sativa Indica Group]
MAGSVVTRSPLCSILFYVLATAAAATATATLVGNITADEEYWAKRSEVARSFNRAAYVSDPVAVLNRFNEDVLNTTTATAAAARRSLMRRYRRRGPCTVTNPIDRCWRCRKNWASRRKRLAKCAMGFGHKATGGLAGKIYIVTDAGDEHLVPPRRDTLRHAVIQERPLWIVFARSMVIRLAKELIVTSDKTIDARGATGDASPARRSRCRRNIWIDHVSMSNCSDGLIDITDGSTAITISNSHFTKHDHVMLFGARDDSPKDKIMQVTLAFNHFGKGLVQRMPRCRFGFFHMVNNDYTHWLMYAIGGNMNPTIISQGNRFRASDDMKLKEVTKREYTSYDEYKEWVWKSQDDLFLNGAFFNESGGRNERRYNRLDLIQARNGRYVGRMTRFAGTLPCRVGKKC